MTPDELMRRAIAIADENVRAGRGGPFGAVVVRDGAIVAEGTNLGTSTNDPTAHAEVVAIRNACRALAKFRLAGCELYASCEPCPLCLGAVYWARLDRLWFAAGRHDAEAAGFDDSHIYRELGVDRLICLPGLDVAGDRRYHGMPIDDVFRSIDHMAELARDW